MRAGFWVNLHKGTKPTTGLSYDWVVLLTLELIKGADEVQEQASSRGGSVYVLGQGMHKAQEFSYNQCIALKQIYPWNSISEKGSIAEVRKRVGKTLRKPM